jgi:hypothetical protein
MNKEHYRKKLLEIIKDITPKYVYTLTEKTILKAITDLEEAAYNEGAGGTHTGDDQG